MRAPRRGSLRLLRPFAAEVHLALARSFGQRTKHRRACSALAFGMAMNCASSARGTDCAAAVDAVAAADRGGLGEDGDVAAPAIRPCVSRRVPVCASPGLAIGRVVQFRIDDLPVPRDGAGVAEERLRLAGALETVAASLIETDLGRRASSPPPIAQLLEDPDSDRPLRIDEIAEGRSAALRLAKRVRFGARTRSARPVIRY